jgi:hypothetical protein
MAAATGFVTIVYLADAGARTWRVRFVHRVLFSAESRVMSKAARLA